MLEGQQKGRQAGEGLLTLGTAEAAGLALLFLDSGSFGLTRAGAVPMDLTAAPWALGEGVCFRVVVQFECHGG